MCSEFAIQIWPIAPQNPIRLWKTSYHIWDLWPVSKIVTLGQLSLLRFEHLYDNAFWEIVIFFWKFPFSQPRTLVEAPAQFEANWQRKLQAKATSSKKTTQQRGGEKPHGCKMCTYTCTSATDLKKHMLFMFTLEKSCSAASSVNSPLHGLVTSRGTCWHIQEKGLSLAWSVSFPTRELVVSRDTCSLTVVWSVSLASSAATNALVPVP